MVRYRETDFGYLVVLRRGEELIRSLLEFARHEDVTAGALHGLGAVERVVLGFFDPEAGAYVRTEWKEPLEVASLVGTLSVLHGEVLPHVHGVFTRRDASAIGGHVFEAVCSVTLELPVYVTSGIFHRSPVPYCPLELIDPTR